MDILVGIICITSIVFMLIFRGVHSTIYCLCTFYIKLIYKVYKEQGLIKINY